MKKKIRKHKHFRGMVLLLVLMFVCTGCTDREENQSALRQQGIEHMQKGEYEKAVKVFQEALDLSLGEVGETELDICFYKAEALFQLGDIEGAENVYSAIIDFNQSPKAYFFRGNLYYSQQEETKALQDYTAATEQEKTDYELYIAIYEVLLANGREELAQEYLKQALEISGEKSYDKMQKGRISFLLGEQESAISFLEEAITGKEMTAYYYLSEVYFSIGESQLAEENLSAYIKSGVADAERLFSIAQTQLEKGNYEMTIECLQFALELEELPNRQELMKMLVVAYEQNLDFSSAKTALESYLKEYPNDEDAQREYTFLETR